MKIDFRAVQTKADTWKKENGLSGPFARVGKPVLLLLPYLEHRVCASPRRGVFVHFGDAAQVFEAFVDGVDGARVGVVAEGPPVERVGRDGGKVAGDEFVERPRLAPRFPLEQMTRDDELGGGETAFYFVIRKKR